MHRLTVNLCLYHVIANGGYDMSIEELVCKQLPVRNVRYTIYDVSGEHDQLHDIYEYSLYTRHGNISQQRLEDFGFLMDLYGDADNYRIEIKFVRR